MLCEYAKANPKTATKWRPWPEKQSPDRDQGRLFKAKVRTNIKG